MNPDRRTTGPLHEAQADPYALAEHAAKEIREQTGEDQFDIAVVLGSGWASAADQLGEVKSTIALDDLPGFVAPTVAGHRNVLASIVVQDRRILLLAGRSHLYEGHSAETVVHPVRTAFAAGCSTVILTNAAGALTPALQPGQPVLISDHLNLTATSPMVGDDPPTTVPSRFCDLTDAYSPRLRSLVRNVDDIPEGVYAGMLGGNYETPAEVQMLARLGADMVGMSTVLETIAARHLGMEVLGISLVTNMGAGIAGAHLDHGDVLRQAEAARPRVLRLLRTVLSQI